jgi:hypothetical protein
MTETNDYISQNVRQDYAQLLNALLPFAQQMLEKHGEFHPFGAAMMANGEIVAAAGYDGTEHPSPEQIVSLLIDGFRSDAGKGKIRAAGLCVNASIQAIGNKKRSDAVQVSLDHSVGESMDLYLPYRRGFLGRYSYGEIKANVGSLSIFPELSGGAA